ncbi:MAG: AraC family transcriptional regulator [Proteobacteria bacterium]|nr:AraC family transcriptional regulator [Pseudomonadota bacterium]
MYRDITTQDNCTILTDQTFDSFEQLSSLATHWGADFRQLNSEYFKSYIFQLVASRILISSAHFGCHVEQRGTTPEGMRTFAVLNEDCPELLWFGQIINQDNLLVFPAHGEIESFSRAGFGVTTISIPADLLAEFFERNGIDIITKAIPPEEVIKKASKTHLNQLRYLLRQLVEIANLAQYQYSAAYSVLVDGVESQILLSIFNIMTEDIFQSRKTWHKISRQVNSRTMRVVLNYIQNHINEQQRVQELCQIAHVSERTLQYLFRQQLGMTPKAYLKGQQLFKVHQALWHVEPSDVKIGAIASQFGFCHMGQFSTDYRKMFGELPSETLSRNNI